MENWLAYNMRILQAKRDHYYQKAMLSDQAQL